VQTKRRSGAGPYWVTKNRCVNEREKNQVFKDRRKGVATITSKMKKKSERGTSGGRQGGGLGRCIKH